MSYNDLLSMFFLHFFMWINYKNQLCFLFYGTLMWLHWSTLTGEVSGRALIWPRPRQNDDSDEAKSWLVLVVIKLFKDNITTDISFNIILD